MVKRHLCNRQFKTWHSAFNDWTMYMLMKRNILNFFTPKRDHFCYTHNFYIIPSIILKLGFRRSYNCSFFFVWLKLSQIRWHAWQGHSCHSVDNSSACGHNQNGCNDSWWCCSFRAHELPFTVTLPRLILQTHVNKIKQTNGGFRDRSDKNRRMALPAAVQYQYL